MNTQPNNPNPPNSTAPDPLAVALSKLDPAPHGIEWNSFMFAAGRASKDRAVLFWRVTTAVCAVIACGFALAFFTRPEVIVARDRVVYVELAPEKAVEPPASVPVPPPGPVPGVAPAIPPAPRPEVPQTSLPLEPPGWTYEQPPEQGVALRWLNTRNEVLTVGLSILPDPGRKVNPPRTDR